MRRLIAGTLFLILGMTSCVTPPAAPRPASPQVRPGTPRSISPRDVPGPRQSEREARGDPAWSPRAGRVSQRWTTIVLHHSATVTGSARSFDRYHRDKGWDELGYHFVIGNGTDTPDGLVEVGSRWHTQKHGAHCKTADNYFNDHGIGICLVGDFTRTRPTQRQLAALERLVAFLCNRCAIPPDRVVSHGAVTHKTACPGRFFPVSTLRRAVASAATATSLPY